MSYKYLIGVDEVGRGPLAGPVAVGVVKVPRGFAWEQIPGVTDSKKLTPENREAIFAAHQKCEALLRTADASSTAGPKGRGAQ